MLQVIWIVKKQKYMIYMLIKENCVYGFKNLKFVVGKEVVKNAKRN